MSFREVTIGPCRLICADCMDVLPAKGNDGEGNDGANRKSLGYGAWSKDDVERYVPLMCSVAKGWVVVMTDHTLAPSICDAMKKTERYVFSPLPWYVPGSRVRLSGDGPSCWTNWIIVSRTAAQSRWGTLPGGYMDRGEQFHMGGKPVELMASLVGDYSRDAETIIDPFMGSGTTGVACIQTERRFIGIEKEPKYFNIACQRIQRAWDLKCSELPFEKPKPLKQLELIAE